MLLRLRSALLGLSILGSIYLCAGQSPAVSQTQPANAQSPTYTLHTESRIVLTDVTVMDRNGQPVHGLPRSAFEIFDDNEPQPIASFEEHTDTNSSFVTTQVTSPGVYSNDFTHLPPVLNVVVVDTTNLDLPDQMYLNLQLTKFINALPAGQPLAVFERHGDVGVLLQSFTADHTLLLAAIHKALPRIVLTGRENRSDTDTLHQIAAYLSQVPGRKNLLWFSGGSTFYLLNGFAEMTPTAGTSNPNGPTGNTTVPLNPNLPSSGEDDDALRQVYDELEAARVAVYPIDARGLTVENDAAYKAQQAQMSETAEATGGEAFFNMNTLAQIAGHIVSTDSSVYTITYSPRGFHYDNKWHTVRVAVKGSYRLSYRRGYFADPPHTLVPGTPNPKKPLNSVMASGETPAVAPDLRNSPIVFEANVHPAGESGGTASDFVPLRPASAAEKGTTVFDVDYSLSTSALTPVEADGASRATVAFAVIALDSDGNRVGQTLDRVRFALDPQASPKHLKVEQQIDLHKGGVYLALVVWDAGSGRIGSLEIPVQVNVSQSK
jgi:VWFA-related protein